RPATVRSRLVTVRRPVVRMAATPKSLARTKVAAVVKADSKRENTGKGSLVILNRRASELQQQEKAPTFMLLHRRPCLADRDHALKTAINGLLRLGIVAKVKLRRGTPGRPAEHGPTTGASRTGRACCPRCRGLTPQRNRLRIARLKQVGTRVRPRRV